MENTLLKLEVKRKNRSRYRVLIKAMSGEEVKQIYKVKQSCPFRYEFLIPLRGHTIIKLIAPIRDLRSLYLQ